MPPDQVPFWDVIASIIWIAGIIGAVVYAIFLGKEFFKWAMTFWTIAVMIFCTPLPLFAFYRSSHSSSETILESADFKYEADKTYKFEHWKYLLSDKIFVDKRFISSKKEIADDNDSTFKKDGTWVYFTNNSDTIKVEQYRQGKLLSVRNKKQHQ